MSKKISQIFRQGHYPILRALVFRAKFIIATILIGLFTLLAVTLVRADVTEKPPHIFRIGPVYQTLWLCKPVFLYTEHPKVDLSLVDKDHPDYPRLANEDMLESGSEHNEDLIDIRLVSARGRRELSNPVDNSRLATSCCEWWWRWGRINLAVDPTDNLLPPYLPHLGEQLRYDPNATYIRDLEVALQKAGYSVWPTVGILYPTTSQVFEASFIACKANFRGAVSYENFHLSIVNYDVLNLPPLIEHIEDQHIYLGDSLDYQVVARDPDFICNDQGFPMPQIIAEYPYIICNYQGLIVPRDQNRLTYEASIDLPGGDDGQSIINPETGLIHYKALASQGFTAKVTVKVTESEGGSYSGREFNLSVEDRKIRYVCPDGRGEKDGFSWQNAGQSIQQAINNAPPGSRVWIAEGVYWENITLKLGISLYGGFHGKELSLEERNPRVHLTTIDGDGRGPVIIGASDTVVDGLVITNGLAETGGGIQCCQSEGVIIRNNLITLNMAGSEGGGVAVDSSSKIQICQNIISDNRAERGAGISCQGTDIGSIANNIIAGNEAERNGGGILLLHSSPLLTNNTIVENKAPEGGPGLCCLENSLPALINSILWDEMSESQSGGEENKLYNLEILVDTDSDCLVNYTNIRKGTESHWQTGAGNIDGDPGFRGQEPGFYHLSLSSPCLDAGDPNITDPDGSPSDMGAYGGKGADWSILIMAVEDRIIRAEKLFNLDISASAPDPAMSLYYSDNTDLFDINPISGKIGFTPDSSHIGEYEIVISITNDLGMTGLCPFHLTIKPGEESYQFISPLQVLVFPIFYPLLFDGLAPYLISPLSPSTWPIVREASPNDLWPGSWPACLWISSFAPYSGYLLPYPFKFFEPSNHPDTLAILL